MQLEGDSCYGLQAAAFDSPPADSSHDPFICRTSSNYPAGGDAVGPDELRAISEHHAGGAAAGGELRLQGDHHPAEGGSVGQYGLRYRSAALERRLGRRVHRLEMRRVRWVA